MMKEDIILIFEKDGRTFNFAWTIKKGYHGIRDTNKVHKLQQEWGDPTEIIGDGPVANLLRKEYKIYNKNPSEYNGISTKDILMVGAEITGIPVQKLQQGFKKIRKKVKNVKT